MVEIAFTEIYNEIQSKECGKHSLVSQALEVCLQLGLLESSASYRSPVFGSPQLPGAAAAVESSVSGFFGCLRSHAYIYVHMNVIKNKKSTLKKEALRCT